MNDILKDGFVGRAGRRTARDARIRKDDVEFAEIFGQGREELLAVFRNGEVSAVATRVWPECSNRLIERSLWSRPVMATCAPSAMKRRAVARPMPLFPPVMRAFLPVSFIMTPSCVTGIKYDGRHT